MNRIMARVLGGFAVLVVAGTGTGLRAQTTGGAEVQKVSSLDRSFLAQGVNLGNVERQLGAMALEKASSAQVKEYARSIIQDHDDLDQTFVTMATVMNVDLPPTTEVAAARTLKDLSGPEFDQAFMATMVDVHRDAISRFEQTVRTGDNAQIRQLASQSLPTLRSHLEQAQRIHEQVMGSESPKGR